MPDLSAEIGREFICPVCGLPRVCESFAGEGGATVGLMRAGFCGYVPRDPGVLEQMLGIDHLMTIKGLYLCIPPIYAEHIARQMPTQAVNGILTLNGR